MGIDQFSERNPVRAYNLIANGYTPGTVTTVLAAVTKDTRIDSLMVASNHSATANAILFLNDGSADRLIGAVAVPSGAGMAVGNAVDVLAALQPSGQPFIMLPAGYALKWSLSVNPGAGLGVQIYGQGGTF